MNRLHDRCYIIRCRNGNYTVVADAAMLDESLRDRQTELLTVEAALEFADRVLGIKFSREYDLAATEALDGFNRDLRVFLEVTEAAR